MTAHNERVLDAGEQELVRQAENPSVLKTSELTELARLLRERRDRVQRMIRERARDAKERGEHQPDAGAREKEAALVDALQRIEAALEVREKG